MDKHDYVHSLGRSNKKRGRIRFTDCWRWMLQNLKRVAERPNVVLYIGNSVLAEYRGYYGDRVLAVAHNFVETFNYERDANQAIPPSLVCRRSGSRHADQVELWIGHVDAADRASRKLGGDYVTFSCPTHPKAPAGETNG